MLPEIARVFSFVCNAKALLRLPLKSDASPHILEWTLSACHFWHCIVSNNTFMASSQLECPAFQLLLSEIHIQKGALLVLVGQLYLLWFPSPSLQPATSSTTSPRAGILMHDCSGVCAKQRSLAGVNVGRCVAGELCGPHNCDTTTAASVSKL